MRLSTSAEVLDQIRRLEGARSLSLDGPWTVAQMLVHCAQSIEYSLAGYPSSKPALFRATVGRIAKSTFLRRGYLSHDLASPIPGAPELAADLEPVEAFARLRQAVDRFAAHEGECAPHFAYGRVTKAEYEALHAMHVADHLSRVTVGA